MDDFIVKNSVSKNIFYVVVFLILVAGGIFMVTQAKDSKEVLWGWAGIVFFGLGAIVFLQRTLTGKPRIVIDENGIFDRTLGVGTIEWRDIENAYKNSITVGIKRSDFISLVLKDPQKYLQRGSKIKAKIAFLNNALGFEKLNINCDGLDDSTDTILDEILDQIALHKTNKTFR
ncbi:MAG: STM3941 family protein [Pyrinomonadaceae bacterium]